MSKDDNLIQTDLNAKDFERKLAKVSENIEDMKVPFKKASVFLDQWVQRNFKGQGSNVGGWEGFAGGGRFIKGKGIDSNAKLLQDTGALRASFRPFFSNKNAGIGSDIPYSKKHEEGMGALPMRRMLPEVNEVIKPMLAIIEAHLYKEANA